VAINGVCYDIGSANYVYFGVRMRNCNSYFLGADPAEAGKYSREATADLVSLYKGDLGVALKNGDWLDQLAGNSRVSGNFKKARGWALAGWDGWPTRGDQPSSNRSFCAPSCPVTVRDGTLTQNQRGSPGPGWDVEGFIQDAKRLQK